MKSHKSLVAITMILMLLLLLALSIEKLLNYSEENTVLRKDVQQLRERLVNCL
jgi:hypothetical protein